MPAIEKKCVSLHPTYQGEVLEWLKRHAWKACSRQNRLAGSNPAASAMKLIFVCHGNICRSPMAEYIMKNLAERRDLDRGLEISSAAVSYEEEGNGLYPYAAQTLTRHEIPYGQHRAHRISLEEYLEADLVIVMDSSNERLLSRITGGREPEKTHRLLEWTGENRDVADPWYTGNFEKAYSDILAGCTALMEHIAKPTDN